MKEAIGNIWEMERDATVITTNGFVKKNGYAVMGRGIAYEAAWRYPKLPGALGSKLSETGNHCYIFKSGGGDYLITFPVKHKWNELASLELIERSAQELVAIVNKEGFTKVVVPRPGCGNGRLSWNIVKPMIEKYFDDRFIVATFRDSKEYYAARNNLTP